MATKRKAQKVKIENGGIKSTLSIIIPVILIFGFLVGGILLFIYLEEGRRIPNEAYIAAEKLVKEETLIGLTLEECKDTVGTIALIDADGNWIFMAGNKSFENGEGTRLYEIFVEHENDVVVRAVLREQK